MTLPGQQHVVALFRHQKRALARFAFTSIGRSALTTASILLMKEFLGGIIGDTGGLAGAVSATLGPQGALAVLAVLLVGTYVGASVMAYDNEVMQQRLVKVLELGMMERLIRHLLSLSVSVFDRQSHGDIVHAVRQDVSELRAVVLSLGKLVLEGLMALGLLASALWLSPRLTLWALAALPLTVLPIVLVARRTLRRSYSVRRTGYVLFDVILQMMRGIRVIKAYCGEEAEARSALEKGRAYFDELIEMVRAQSLARVMLESLAGLGIVVVVVVGGLEVLRGTLDWPSLLAFLMCVRGLHGPLNNLNTAYVEIKRRGASVSRIADLLETRSDVPDRPDALPLPKAPTRISFDRVSFGYGDTVVLHDLSFDVRAGELIGIAGPSGAGKSTLLNLVARFYDPSTGSVRYDDRDVRDYRLADVYDKVAIVTQEPFLFAASVRDNIRCGRPSAADVEVEQAARDAGIHDEVAALPQGYETVVGTGGHGLSLGQAQRISIARAILKNAPILLLDEATSSLDSIAEAKVQEAIDTLMTGRTTIVVAHRLSTIRNSSRILVLEGGRCVAFDAHEQLLGHCALYRQLWTKQVGVRPLTAPALHEIPDD
ncbi:MAG: ABC transporter ATP-binding protein [Gemmatimonadota bacterium]